MGEGIAQNFAQAGLQVRLIDRETGILKKCLNQIEANLYQFAELNLLEESIELIKARITPYMAEDLAEALQGCSFVIEAIPEILQLKRELVSRIDAVCPEAIIGSNTSSFTISAIAAASPFAGRIVGTHYFNPAHIIPLVELHRGKDTRDDVVNLTRHLMERVGKIPVMVLKEVPGFIVNRIQGAMEREIDYLIDEGIVSPEDLDRAAKASYGFRLACIGPMEAEDMIGLDTALRVSTSIYKTLSNKTTPSPTLAEKVARGELGQKSGMGWYDYRRKAPRQVKKESYQKLIEQLNLFNRRQTKTNCK
jgi:3-hydroxyacyl-CoA dehydrogenase